MKAWQKTIVMLSIILAASVGFLIGQKHPIERPIDPIKEKVDTLYVRDTITLSKPIYVNRRVVDSVRIAVTDTLRMRDTLFVYLEREQIEWRDSLCAVYASGIRPNVDSVKHFVTDRYITIEKTIAQPVKTRWGLGVQAGYGVGSGGLTPWVGVGVSYNLLSW